MQIEKLEDTLVHLLKVKEYELLCSEIQSQVLNIEMSSYLDMLLYHDYCARLVEALAY